MRVFAPAAFRYPPGPSGTDYPYGWQELPQALADTLTAAGYLVGDKPDGGDLKPGEGMLKYKTTSDGEIRIPGSVDSVPTIPGVNARAMARRVTHQKLIGQWSALAATVDRTTRMAINIDVKYSSIQIRAMHFGTVGAAVGGRFLIAASDDIGDCNFATLNGASTKKAFSPRRAGTEYPTLSYYGWRKVTFAGADTYGLADSGNANRMTILDSDVIECPAIEDVSRPGQYPLLISWHPGAGGVTRGSMGGAATGTQYKDDIGNGLMWAYKSGDYMTTPESWSYAQNPDAVVDYMLPYCLITAFSGDRKKGKSIAMIGDSRFDSATGSGGQPYQALAFQVEKALKQKGVSSGVVRVCRSSMPSPTYHEWAMQHLNGPNPPTVAVYLAYSVNDGSASDQLLNACRARTLEFVHKCASVGTIPIIVSLFPQQTLTAGQYPLMAAFDDWCRDLGYLYFSPLKTYGDSAGLWTGGWNIDNYHMTLAGYIDMASRVANIAAPYMG